jgi:hypothetical protein
MSILTRLLIVIFLLLSIGAHSQKLYENKIRGPYRLLYKLTPEQALYVVKHHSPQDSQFLFTNLVGKISVDSLIPLKKIPNDSFPIKPFTNLSKYQKYMSKFGTWDIKQNGYFLEVEVNSLLFANYRLIENPLFNAGIHKIGYETFVFVEDTAGLPVYNAKVQLGVHICVFDSSMGGYRIPTDTIKGILKIERGDQFSLSNVYGNIDKSNNSQPPKDVYKYSKVRYQGYLVTNKPKYKTWDTLFFKSFLVNAKGKPIKEKLMVRLYQNYSGVFKQFEIKPKQKGDYHGYFVINDSFIMDQELIITLQSRKRGTIKSQSVRLENYELKDIRFEMKADKQLVTPGGGIKFYITATTANKLPIMDGKLNFNISLSHVNFTDGDSVVITENKYKNWYSRSIQTDPSGVTVFDLPDSIFIALDGVFSVNCQLMTSDNESRKANLTFSYQTTRDRLESSLEKDTLKVKRLYNMKSVERTMHLKLWSKKDLIGDSIFKTPFHLYLPPNIYMAQIFNGDTLCGTFYRLTELPEINGKRTHDSIHISFKSTFDIPVFYRIYANNRLVASGQKTTLDWHAFDKSKNSYHLQYGILEGSVVSPRFYSQSFHLAEKELTVTIIQPEIIYPGQEVPIEIVVKDAYGKPVNKVNLAAWAVNLQLDDIITPDVPYLGLFKTQKALPTVNWPIYSFAQSFMTYFKDWQLEAYGLLKNDIFKLAYPNKGFQVLTDTTPHHTTEIEFFAHGKRLHQTIIYVKANDSLLLSKKNNPNPPIIRIKPGKYKFTIRTSIKLYTFNDVEIIEGKKNFVCLNLDSLDKLALGDSAKGYLDSNELSMFFNHTLLLMPDQYLNDTFIIKVNGKIKHGFNSQMQHLNVLPRVIVSNPLYNPDRSVKYQQSKQEFFMYGPLNEGDEIELYWKNNYSHLLKFKPGQSIRFTAKDLVYEYLPDWTKEIRFSETSNNMTYKFDNFWWDPEIKDTIKIPKSNNPPVSPQYYSGELKEYVYKNYNHSYLNPVVINSNIHLYLSSKFSSKRIWLFNRGDSTYSNLENGYTFNQHYENIGMNARRFLSTYSPKKQFQNYRLVMEINDSTWFVKNISIDSSVHLFLTINPSQFRKLGKAEHLFYDRLAKNLTREELIKWLDSPTVNKGLFLVQIKQLNGKTGLEGIVTGPNIKYPVDNAFVVLEKNGLFIRGAFTNKEGRFLMEEIPAGTYMLKIKSNQYHYWLHYSIQINSGFNHLLQVEMKPYAWLKYSKNEVLNLPYNENATNYYTSPSYSGSANNSYSNFELNSVNIQTIKSARSIRARNLVKRKKTMEDKDNIEEDAIALSESEESDMQEKPDEKVQMTGDGDDNNSQKTSETGWNKNKQKTEADRLKQLAKDKNAKQTRINFQDYAYWKPSLYTNKQGRAGFSVKYPDNITAWQTFVPAMDGHRHSGLGEMTVRSYKPISTTLALPFFLTEGDSLLTYGRIMNYTGHSQTGKYSLKYKQTELVKDILINDFYTDSIQVIATKPGDTLNIETSFELPEGYRDAELRKILVQPRNVIGGKSWFTEISNDTTFTLEANRDDIGMDIAIYNQKLALIIEMIGKIEEVSVYDNRSLAAYLNALLIKKTVCTTLNLPFTQERKIKETISKLKKAQSDNGFFPWFKGGKNTYVVSTYAAEILFKAHQMGYENNSWLNAARFMEKNVNATVGQERLEYLLCLKKMNRLFPYDSFIRPLKPDLMNKTEKLKYMRLLQLNGKTIQLNQITELLETSPEGNLKVSGIWNWRIAPITDDAANTYAAWEILFDANTYTIYRKAMVDYLSTECPSFGNSWIKAANAMLLEAMRDSSLNATFKPQVFVNNEIIPMDKLPAIYHLKPGETITIKHLGAPIYLAANRKFKTYSPKNDSTQFQIDINPTTLNANKLKSGIPVEMKVHVFAKRTQYNTVIEIPIPAGCVYGMKIQYENSCETHREYQMDRVLIFCDEMAFGYYTFTVNLIPRFNGFFNTAPARSALMFYPDKAAYTPIGYWKIGK